MKNFYSIKNAFIAVAVAVIGLAMASCNGKVSEIQKTIPDRKSTRLNSSH